MSDFKHIDSVLSSVPVNIVVNYCAHGNCACEGAVNGILHPNRIHKYEWSVWISENRERLSKELAEYKLDRSVKYVL